MCKVRCALIKWFYYVLLQKRIAVVHKSSFVVIIIRNRRPRDISKVQLTWIELTEIVVSVWLDESFLCWKSINSNLHLNTNLIPNNDNLRVEVNVANSERYLQSLDNQACKSNSLFQISYLK